jgi:hypothetical protein
MVCLTAFFNQILMLASTVVALQVVAYHVHLLLAFMSLALNIFNRGHELPNMLGIVVVACMLFA